MSLTLEVIGQKAAQMGGAVRKVFTTSGTIGRLRDNDWVFPDEYISGHHAKISFANGAFLIEDTSTNGVFINSPDNRLARGKPYTLRNGDTVFIDDYEVRVTLSREAAVTSPFPSSTGASLVSEDPFFVDDPRAFSSPQDTDPLKLLGLEEKPAKPAGPRAAGLVRGSPLSQHFQPPAASLPRRNDPLAEDDEEGGEGYIPEDYDPMGTDELPVLKAPRTSELRAKEASAPRSSPDTASIGTEGPPRIPRPGARPAPGARVAKGAPVVPEVMCVPPPEAAAWPSPRPAGAKPRAVPAAVVSSGAERRARPDRRSQNGAGGDLDFEALLEGAGITADRVTPELSQQFGKILRVVVAGLMDILRARDKLKEEFRLRITTFKPQDNNPLKFSANVEDALHNLMVKRNPAYLGAVESFEDAFTDVRNHQMAMLAGVRVAYEAMLAEFDPQRLQAEFDAGAKGGSFLGVSGKQKYWELYRKKFRDMVKDADSSFRHLFGDDFAKAYEDQLARLKDAKRSERR